MPLGLRDVPRLLVTPEKRLWAWTWGPSLVKKWDSFRPMS
ncbi:hypothetical protein [Azospirillum argentinense]